MAKTKPPKKRATPALAAEGVALSPPAESSSPASPLNFRDRIVEFTRIRAGDLKPSPKNWRVHPQSQRDALRGILGEVGYVDALMARRLPDGSLELVDGHLRAEDNPDQELPVLIVDLTDDEAAKVLATFDPLAALAETDTEALRSLLAEVDLTAENEELRKMLVQFTASEGLAPELPPDIDDVPPPPATPITQPGDLWLLGVYFECDTCGKKYEYDVGKKMKGRCPCG